MNDLDWLPRKSWLNSAGTAGYVPDTSFVSTFPEITLFVTNPISFIKQNPVDTRSIISGKEGFWVNTGFPNPGFRNAIRRYSRFWENAILPICIHLILDDPDQSKMMADNLEDLENIFALEISFAPDLPYNQILENLDAIRCKIPVILSLPPERISEIWHFPESSLHFAAISLQAPRGVMFLQQIPVQGRLYGRNTLPITLNAVKTLKNIGIDFPIFAGSGVFSVEDLEKLYNLGIYAFQMHEIAWIGTGFNVQAKL